MNCLWLSKWKKKKKTKKNNTGCKVCMGFHYIGKRESYNMRRPVQRVNRGLILSSLGPPCMLKPESDRSFSSSIPRPKK